MAARGWMVISSGWSSATKQRPCYQFDMQKKKKETNFPLHKTVHWITPLDTELPITSPGMSNLQLFPVSSLLIGSTLLVDSIANGTTALINLERSWVRAPGEPDCACLFRLLESILCSVREDSCYYNSVLFFRQHSIIPPHLRESKIPFSPLKSFGIWHSLSYGFTYIYDSCPGVIYSILKEMSFALLQNWAVLVCRDTSPPQ